MPLSISRYDGQWVDVHHHRSGVSFSFQTLQAEGYRYARIEMTPDPRVVFHASRNGLSYRFVVDGDDLVVELKRPTNDFLVMLTMYDSDKDFIIHRREAKKKECGR